MNLSKKYIKQKIKEKQKSEELASKIQKPQYSDIYSGLMQQFPDESEEYIEQHANKMYAFEKENYEKYITEVDGKKFFNVSNFLNGVGDFHRPSVNSSKLLKDNAVQDLIQSTEQNRNAIKNVSYQLYNYVQEYKKLINYYDMLYYRAVINPKESIDKEDFIKTLEYFEGYNYKLKLGEITKKVLLQDVYFGYELSYNGTTKKTLMEFPFDWCQIVGKDKSDVYIYKFDLSYFNNHKESISNFPIEIQNAYNRLSNNKRGANWYTPNVNKQFAFKLDTGVNYSLPFFSGIFVDMVRLHEIKEIQTDASRSDNYKLIHMKIPIDESGGEADKYLIDEGVEVYHENASANLPSLFGIITNPFDVEVLNLKDNNEQNSNIVDRHFGNLLSSAGVSRMLFNSSSVSSTGIKASIKMDENMMFKLLRQYEAFFNRQIANNIKGKSVYSVNFINQTVHNEEEVYNRYMKIAEHGGNYSYVSASVGITQLEAIYGRQAEKIVGFDDAWDTPLATSYQQSADDTNKKDEVDLSDDGVEARD